MKSGPDTPQFFQQQQQPQQQRGDGTWQQQGRRKRGKRGGLKNTQQQLQATAQELPPQPQQPQQPPVPQYQWVVNPSASTSQLGYFAAPFVAPSPPPPQTPYPTFNRALQLARKLDVRPSIETLKTLEVAEITASTDPRPSKRTRKEKNQPRGEIQG